MIELTLPLPPNRANAREHWRVTHRKKKEYYERAMYALANQVPRPSRPMKRPTLTATLYVWNPMDADNRTARIKFPLDCLVRYGLLADDSEKHLDFTEIPKQVVDRKNMRVVLRLTEAA